MQKREFDNKAKTLKDEYGQVAKIHKNGQLSFYESQSDFVFSIKNEFQGANINQTNIGLFDFFYTYERGLVSEVKFLNEKFAYSYDEYDRLNSFTWGDSTYSLHYDHSRMISTNPFISKIQRDSRDLVTSINFTNDLTLNYERDELGRIINQVFKNNEKRYILHLFHILLIKNLVIRLQALSILFWARTYRVLINTLIYQ